MSALTSTVRPGPVSSTPAIPNPPIPVVTVYPAASREVERVRAVCSSISESSGC